MKPLWSDWRKIGFNVMRWGVEIVKPLLKENQYWLLETVINDVELCVERDIQLKKIDPVSLEKLALQIKAPAWLWDSSYYYFTLDDFRTVVTRDFIDKLKWLTDVFDCNNFATLFSSIMAVIFGCNSAGIALGACLDKNTRKIIGYHAYNCLPLESDGKVELYLYEPQDDYLNKAQKETDMGWAIYRTDLIIWR